MVQHECPRCMLPNVPTAQNCRFCAEPISKAIVGPESTQRPEPFDMESSAGLPVLSDLSSSRVPEVSTNAGGYPRLPQRPGPAPMNPQSELTAFTSYILRNWWPLWLFVGLAGTCQVCVECMKPIPPTPEQVRKREESAERDRLERVRLKADRQKKWDDDHARWNEEARIRQEQWDKENKIRRSHAVCCCDGTESPTCTYAHSGCCSHRGGICRCR